jgi:hypothetical protein
MNKNIDKMEDSSHFMHIKIHESYRTVVALVDSELIGQVFEEGIKRIEIKPGFFEGEEKTKEGIIEILKDMDREDATFNIVGKNSVAAAVEAGVITGNGIMKIQNIPIALGLF